MSDCGVCIGGGDYDGPLEFYSAEIVKARKEHKCCECRRLIAKGEKYERYSCKFDGDFSSSKTCLACSEIRDAFSCGGGVDIGGMWSEMADYVFPALNTTCFDRLQTAMAKEYLRERWMRWKFRERH